MQKFDEWFLPDGEQHLKKWMQDVGKVVDGRLTYQYHKYEAAMKYVKNMRVAVDVGAHVGFWSFFMARDFKDVAAFEPMAEHQLCWHENMRKINNAELFTQALGNSAGRVQLETRTHGSSGDTQVVPDEQVDVNKCGRFVPMVTLDSLNFPFVDFIKVDCEGYELNVLQGAEATLKKSKPVVVVEQKGNMIERYGHEKLAAVKYLESLGAKVREEISGDFIMSWDAE